MRNSEEEKDLAINWSEGRGFWELGWEVQTMVKEVTVSGTGRERRCIGGEVREEKKGLISWGLAGS